MMDDEWYGTNLVTNQPLRGLSDIIESQIWHFRNWGGRCMTHGILQLTLMSGEFMADMLNMAAFASGMDDLCGGRMEETICFSAVFFSDSCIESQRQDEYVLAVRNRQLCLFCGMDSGVYPALSAAGEDA